MLRVDVNIKLDEFASIAYKQWLLSAVFLSVVGAVATGLFVRGIIVHMGAVDVQLPYANGARETLLALFVLYLVPSATVLCVGLYRLATYLLNPGHIFWSYVEGKIKSE
jgi:hypothetical protein